MKRCWWCSCRVGAKTGEVIKTTLTPGQQLVHKKCVRRVREQEKAPVETRP